MTPDEFGAGALRGGEEQFQPPRRRPVIGILHQVGVIAGLVNDGLGEPVGTNILGTGQERDRREVADDVGRRGSRAVVDDDDAVEGMRLPHQGVQAVAKPRVALVVRHDGEYRGAAAQLCA